MQIDIDAHVFPAGLNAESDLFSITGMQIVLRIVKWSLAISLSWRCKRLFSACCVRFISLERGAVINERTYNWIFY